MASAPVTPPEPLLFSMMNVWLVSFSSSRQTMRDSVSVGPPAGNTTMYLTGLLGQSLCARATPDPIIGAAIMGAVSAPPDRMSARRRGRISFVIFYAAFPVFSRWFTFYAKSSGLRHRFGVRTKT